MTEFERRTLLLQLAEALGLGDARALADHGTALVEGLRLHLRAAPATSAEPADRWVLHIEVGEVPERQWALALERLMRLNLLSGSKTTGVFALAPFGRQVVYAVHLFDLAERAPAAVAAGLRQHLDHARAALELLHAPDGGPAPSGDTTLPLSVPPHALAP